MRTQLKEIRIAGYRFIFEFDLVDTPFIHMGFKRRDYRISKVFIGGKRLYIEPTQAFSLSEAEIEMIGKIQWTFKR